jgi:hypothetical protein
MVGERTDPRDVFGGVAGVAHLHAIEAQRPERLEPRASGESCLPVA